MTRDLIVDVLVTGGVAAELVCCLGVLAMRSAIDRLHYAGAAATLGPALVAAAVCVREGLVSSQGLNLLLIPRYGIKAAAWNTVAGFATLALLQGLLAARRYRIAWEYRRWAILTVVGVGAYFAVQLPAPGISAKRYVLSVVALAAFPVVLTVVGFWTTEERQWLRRHLLRAA